MTARTPAARRPHHPAPLLLAAALLAGVAAPAAAAPDADLAERLDALFADAYPADGPGAAVRIERGGEVVLRAGYGMADLELGVPIEPDMVFRLGSITKQLTAAAVLLLVEDGAIELDDTVATHLPDYDGPASGVTVHQLLTHTGGVPSYTSLASYGERMREDLETGGMIERFRELPLEFEPGTRWSYSNSGYYLLGLIAEAASGESYEELVEGRIFEPLGMTRSRYGRVSEIVPGRVEGYQGGPGEYENAAYLSMTQPYAAGSLLSTVDDLARWDAALDAGEILTTEHRELLARAVELPDGASSGYGYGVSVGEYEGHRTIHHGGGINGFLTYLIRVPDEDVLVAVLSNQTAVQPAPLAFRAMAITLGAPLDERPSIELPPAELEALVGVYAIGGPESDDLRVLTLDGDRIVSQRTGGQRSPIRFSAPDRFYFPDTPTRGRFVRDEAGAVTGMWVTPVVGPEEWAVKTDRPIPEEGGREMPGERVD